MKLSLTRFGSTGLIASGIGLALLVAVLATTTVTSYRSANTTCLNVPQSYSFMATRFHNGSCQFRENEGWETFTPAS